MAEQNQQDGKPVASTPAGSGKAPVKEDQGHATEPSGSSGDNPSTAGPGPTKVHANTPENDTGEINPSAPEDSNTTPGTTTEK